MKLPEYTIDGTVFNVNSAKLQLEQADNPSNVIPFSDMDYRGNHYLLLYDQKEKNVPRISASDNGALAWKIIPQLVDLDPEGMAAKFNLSREQLLGKRDFDLLVDQDLLKRRLSGELPVVDIAGHDFIFDNTLKEFRDVDNPENKIRLNLLLFEPEAQIYMGFHFIPTNSLIGIDLASLTVLMKTIVMVEIPSGAKLDPVGFAQENKLELRTTLMKQPLQEKQVIPTIPLSRTLIPLLIRQNNRNRGIYPDEKPVSELKKKRGYRL